jgi:histidine triad (HIT) family protein
MDNCIFCKIANGLIPSATVYEDEDFRIILDMNQKIRGHMLILPKQHYANLYELPPQLAAKAMLLAQKAAKACQKTMDIDGLNLLQNNGEAAGQSVMHFHLHVLPRKKGDDPKFPAWDEESISSEEMKELADKLSQQLS